MSLQLADSEQEALLSTAHTAMFTTLRRDGWPVTLPVWFAWTDGRMLVGTPKDSAKMKRIRRDDRCCVLVESGSAWVDLAAVEFSARAVLLAPGPETDAAKRLIDEKYAEFQPPWERLPRAVVAHYATQVYLRLEPVGPLISWDNSKVRLRPE
jgi:PPOX class probable F420-dependent enzyme